MAEEASTQGRSSQTRRKLAPRSGVWVHFTRFTDDDGNDKARCKRCSLVIGASTRNGTSTLRAHVRICWGDEAIAAASNSRAPQLLLGSSPGRRGEPAGLQGKQRRWEDLARMITLHGYESSFVEDDYFRSFVRSLSPEFELPSRLSIEEMCDDIFDEARRDLLSRLMNAPARFSVAMDIANKTTEAGEVIYTACHFIDDEWNLRKLVLQVAVVDYAAGVSEYGPILGVRVVTGLLDSFQDMANILFKHDILDRLSMVAHDDNFHPVMKNWIEVNINRLTNLSCSNTTFVDNVLHEIAGFLLPCSNFSIKHLYATVDLTRQTSQQLLSHCGLDNPWTYTESWYSCYCSIKVTLHKEGYSSVDVDIASLLCKVWGTIHQAIQRIFASTSNICLRELFNVREVLHSVLAKASELAKASDYWKKYDWFIKASNTLDKAIQDSYLIWSVPFVLDPRYKLELLKFCFERAFGSEEAAKYVSEVTTRTNELYDYYIKQYERVTGAGHSNSANNAMMATTSADPLEQAWNEHRRQQDVIMVDQVNCTYPETQTELHRYLQDPLVPSTQDFDILDWWKAHSSEYPTVALMASDALAMPTCSKLSSDQIAQVRSMVRGYSKKPYGDQRGGLQWRIYGRLQPPNRTSATGGLQDDTEEEE